MFSFPAEMAVDKIMDAFRVASGPSGLQYFQHHSGVTFLVAVSSMAVANGLVQQQFLGHSRYL